MLATSCSGKINPPDGQIAGTAEPGQSFTISGTVTPSSTATGVMITLSGASSASTIAGATGSFSFAGLASGTYAVTPSKNGFTFNPTTQAATVSGTNVTSVNFTASAQTGPNFTISGNISPASSGKGSAVILTGPVGATATADASGNYIFPGLVNGSYSITPNKSGFEFSPTTLAETVDGADVLNANFTATASSQQTHSVSLSWTASTSTVSGYNVYRSTTTGSGFTKLNAAVLPGLAFSDTNVTPGTTYFYVATAVDSGGDESADSNQVSAVIP
jgi:hypothetical protein